MLCKIALILFSFTLNAHASIAHIKKGIRIADYQSLTAKQQVLFNQYFTSKVAIAGSTAEDYWNASKETANAEQRATQWQGKKLLSQSQLTSFIGVTSMWEASKTIDLVASIEEIREISSKDGFRIIGTFKPGGGEFIKSRWKKGGMKKKEFVLGRREPASSSIKGQFTLTRDLKRFNSDVDYHPASHFWLHLRHENSDIRKEKMLHHHLKGHIKRYSHIYAPHKFPISYRGLN